MIAPLNVHRMVLHQLIHNKMRTRSSVKDISYDVKVVHHQARKYGHTKFGLDRFVNGYLDLGTLWFQSRFGVKPMHIFGLLGSAMFAIGFLAVLVVLILKIVSIFHPDYHFYVTNSVYFYLSLAAMIMGLQFFLSGFIGELITRNSPERNNYLIAEEI